MNRLLVKPFDSVQICSVLTQSGQTKPYFYPGCIYSSREMVRVGQLFTLTSHFTGCEQKLVSEVQYI